MLLFFYRRLMGRLSAGNEGLRRDEGLIGHGGEDWIVRSGKMWVASYVMAVPHLDYIYKTLSVGIA